MTEQTEPTRRQDSHLTVYLAWPALAGLVLGTVLGVSLFGVLAITTGDVVQAARVAGLAFFISLGLVAFGTFIYAAREWRGPRQRERIETTRQTVIEVAAPEQPPRFIPLGGRPAALTQPAPGIPSTAKERGLVATAIGALSSSLAKRATITTVEQTAETIAPSAPAWVQECYQVLCGSWPDKLTRRHWNASFENGTALWKRWINGDGSGRHGGAGIFQTWGVVEKRDGRGGWQYTQSLATILSLDAELKAYADARAALVKHSPRLGTTTGIGAKTEPKPNQTKRQTKNQSGGG